MQQLEQFSVAVVEQRVVADEHFELVMEAHPALERTAPGQFVNVSVAAPGSFDPLLRRPFSLYRTLSDGNYSILYRVVGRGTRALAQLAPGDRLELLAPLGRGFTRLPGTERPILVGGGVGVPPLFMWAQKELAPEGSLRAILGFNSANLVIGANDMEELGVDVEVTTVDGSRGRKGFVTDALRPHLEAGSVDGIYACGPKPMLAAVAEMAKQFQVPAQLALEEWMGCGVGACLSCVVPVRSEGGESVYRRVCVEGPVFSAEEVLFS